jgi:hypothetical protein
VRLMKILQTGSLAWRNKSRRSLELRGAKGPLWPVGAAAP